MIVAHSALPTSLSFYISYPKLTRGIAVKKIIFGYYHAILQLQDPTKVLYMLSQIHLVAFMKMFSVFFLVNSQGFKLLKQNKIWSDIFRYESSWLLEKREWYNAYEFLSAIVRWFGSINVSGKLFTYPSFKLTLILTSHQGQNDGLGEG